MDVAFFMAGIVIGTGVGLVCKKNNFQLFSSNLSLGFLSQEHQRKKENEFILSREDDENYNIRFGNRYRKEY